MFLLDWYKKKKIVVAHVNYHKRKDSTIDEEIVKVFCQKHNIPFYSLSVKKKPEGNFQSWARKIRYDFFKKIYIENNCDQLVMGHHKDDFLETAIMQQRSGRTPRYFGIRKKNTVDDMNIHRPFISLYWKDEIIKNLDKDNIEYAIDSSNQEPIFERNKIRIELSKKALKEKQSIYKWFKMSNKILVKKFKKIDYLYLKWKKAEYKTIFIMNSKYQEEIIFEFINDHFNSIKLSKGKIKSLVSFIESNNGGKEYKLSSKESIYIKNGKVVW